VGSFDNMDHTVMVESLREKIADERFITLIKAMLHAGYLEEWAFNATYSGTPQGGICTPPTMLQNRGIRG